MKQLTSLFIIFTLCAFMPTKTTYYQALRQVEDWNGKDGRDGDRGPLQITPPFYKDAVEQLKKEGKPYPPFKSLNLLQPSKVICDAYYRRYKLTTPYDKARAHNNGPNYKGKSDYAQRVVNLMSK